MAEELLEYSPINLILSHLGAYVERMKRKVYLGELGEFPLPMKNREYPLLVEGMETTTAQKLWVELVQRQWTVNSPTTSPAVQLRDTGS